jgi:hypothetical protein
MQHQLVMDLRSAAPMSRKRVDASQPEAPALVDARSGGIVGDDRDRSAIGPKESSLAHVKPDYGLDAPTVVRNLALGGVAAAIVAVLAQVLPAGPPMTQGDRNSMSTWFALTALALLATSGWMLYSSKVGKLRMRERVVDGLDLRADERVLDVGCGRGLMLVAAAKRLPKDTRSASISGAPATSAATGPKWRSRTPGWKGSRNGSKWRRATCERCPSPMAASTPLGGDPGEGDLGTGGYTW